jgi:hypothetical protein
VCHALFILFRDARTESVPMTAKLVAVMAGALGGTEGGGGKSFGLG